MEKTIISPLLNPLTLVVNYIQSKQMTAQLSPDQIEKRLLGGECFEMVRGEGTDLDTKLMQQILAENDFYEKNAQKVLKDQAMRFIIEVVQHWSVQIAQQEMRINQDQIHNYTAKLLPFGSYVLDLRSNSSDIDLICVCPNFIQRQTHFFNDLATRLQSKSEVKSLATRTNAKVPIITFQYKDIDIDISFCQLQGQTVPRDIQKVISNQLLATIKDQQSKTSLIGRKNNLMIVELTGKQSENFKEALRIIKVWAKNRGISSNAMGYLGGISWAILVAKICQIFPHHKPSKLIYQFFTIYSIWNWKIPLRITASQQPIPEDKYKDALMSIITPASEYNSTERVNAITFKVICEQIKRANQILLGKKDISQICKKMDFFNIYPFFIEIDICGYNKAKQDQKQYKDFQGLVESRLLKLIQNLFKYHKRQIQDGTFKVVPNPKMFKKNDTEYQYCNSIFFGLDLMSDIQINVARAVKEWISTLENCRTKNLNIRVFEGIREDFTDVEIIENKKKKEQKEDPRLAMRRKKQQ